MTVLLPLKYVLCMCEIYLCIHDISISLSFYFTSWVIQRPSHHQNNQKLFQSYCLKILSAETQIVCVVWLLPAGSCLLCLSVHHLPFWNLSDTVHKPHLQPPALQQQHLCNITSTWCEWVCVCLIWIPVHSPPAQSNMSVHKEWAALCEDHQLILTNLIYSFACVAA